MKQIISLILFVGLLTTSSAVFSQNNKMIRVAKKECFAAATDKDMSDLNRACRDNDEPAVSKMVRQGKVFVIAKGTKVRLIKSGLATCTVIVFDGIHKEKTVIMDVGALTKP